MAKTLFIKHFVANGEFTHIEPRFQWVNDETGTLPEDVVVCIDTDVETGESTYSNPIGLIALMEFNDQVRKLESTI